MGETGPTQRRGVYKEHGSVRGRGFRVGVCRGREHDCQHRGQRNGRSSPEDRGRDCEEAGEEVSSFQQSVISTRLWLLPPFSELGYCPCPRTFDPPFLAPVRSKVPVHSTQPIPLSEYFLPQVR